jgi:hypothetical protein
MNEGKVRADTRFLSKKRSVGAHNLYIYINDKSDRRSVREILKEKQPEAAPVDPEKLTGFSS